MRKPAICALAAAVLFGCWRSPRAIQRDYARAMTPQELQSHTPEGTLTIAHVRVWADEDFRHTLAWKESFERQVAAANEVLAGLGVSLQVDAYRDWHHPTSESSLTELLRELRRLDAGEGADWVIGLTTGLPIVTAAQHHLGMAEVWGNHFVVRAMDSQDEYEHFVLGLTALPDEERQEVYLKRRRHKEVAVLLHEWAHTLGALHVRPREGLMAPVYDHRQAAFLPANEAIIRLGLAQRLRGYRDAPANNWKAALADVIRDAPTDVWDPEDRDRTLEYLAGNEVSNTPLPAADAEAVQLARRLIDQGDLVTTWSVVARLLEAQPGHPDVLELACYAAFRRNPTGDDVVRFCEQARDAAPHRPLAVLVGADALARRGAAKDARGLLLAHRGDFDKLAEDQWRYLSELYGHLFLPTLAEAAAQRAQESERARLLTSITSLRRRMGLPQEAGRLTPEQESDYLERLQAGFDALAKGRINQATGEASRLADNYPALPGSAILTCQVQVARRSLAEALRACGAALDIYDAGVLAHLGFASAAAAEGQNRKAIEHAKQLSRSTQRTSVAGSYSSSSTNAPATARQQQICVSVFVPSLGATREQLGGVTADCLYQGRLGYTRGTRHEVVRATGSLLGTGKRAQTQAPELRAARALAIRQLIIRVDSTTGAGVT